MPPAGLDLASASPVTLADWRAAYRAGATPISLLAPLRERLAASLPDAAWIALATPAQLDAQLAALDAAATQHADRDALLQALPFYGVPYAVKDNIDIAGVPTTAACPAFSYDAEADAAVVACLRAAGAVWLGKTNLDQFATGLVGTRSPYGRPASTFDAERISGGSSSGSAVVVARGDVPFALGTDTAGSGRVPAGFNNIVGLKPTPGRVSTCGVLPACRSLDCVAVFALSVIDAAQVLALIEGPDPRDIYSDFRPGPAAFPERLRVGIPQMPAWAGDAAASGYPAAFDAALAQLRTLGHKPVPIDFQALHAVAELLYDGPWVAERHAVVQALLDDDPDALDPSVRQVIERALRFTATGAFRGLYALRAARRDTAGLFAAPAGVDVLMVPTTPFHPKFSAVDADPLSVNSVLGTYTNFVNLLGWCALAVPAGLTAAGLPFGVTFIAPGGSDAALARLGQAWQASLALPLGATHRPFTIEAALATPAVRATLPIAVVGAHLSGLPLNGQLTERGATLQEATQTAPRYRLYALPDTTPPKPGLLRVADDAGGEAVAVEVWDLPLAAVGSFLALIPPPLGLGSIELADGRFVHGFICEAHALAGAQDISLFGGWRAYLASL